MPVTHMTRIDDAQKCIHELLPAGKSESTQYARFDHFITNKLLLEDPTINLITPLKEIFLIAGIVICVLCGSTQESKAALQTPSIATDVPCYDLYYSQYINLSTAAFSAGVPLVLLYCTSLLLLFYSRRMRRLFWLFLHTGCARSNVRPEAEFHLFFFTRN